MQNIKRIYKRGFAEFLVDNGCELLRMVPDIGDPTKINWVFEDDEKLRAAMSEYTRRLNESRK